MLNVRSLFSAPSLARTIAFPVPRGSEAPGVRRMFPVVGLVVVTVMNVGPITLLNVRASPSGSEPLMAWSTKLGPHPGCTVMSDTGFRFGARLVFAMDNPVVAVLVAFEAPVPSFTVHTML